MTADHMTATTAPPPAQGATNLDRLLETFAPIPVALASVRQQIPDLQRAQQGIHQQINRIQDLCHAYGAPTVVWQLLAEGAHVSATLGIGLQAVEQSNETAAELAEQALAGLRPAREDLQDVHRQGASGEMLAPAA